MSTLKPCPHCGLHLLEVSLFATRTSKTYTHPSDTDCVGQFVRVIVGGDNDNSASWNRREGGNGINFYMARLRAEALNRLSGGAKVGDWLPVASLSRLLPGPNAEPRVSASLADFDGQRYPDRSHLPFAIWSVNVADIDLFEVAYDGTGWRKTPMDSGDAWAVAR